MCGLAGYLLTRRQELSSETILQMLELQRHRGPDDSGILGINVTDNSLEELSPDFQSLFSINPNLIFGFNRLSILDLTSSGHQPMINNSQKVALMMNGEVYNAFDYKSELMANGYKFFGNSDTEVVLYLYLEYGLEGMLSRLNGMFAIAIYDGRVRNLYLIRDRMGIKPLYVLQEASRISFSSEMKTFKALPSFKFELDESRISEFLIFRNAINNTLFKNIVNITPGTYWVINNEGNIRVSSYFSILNDRTDYHIVSKEDIKGTLRKAVKRQMVSDVKLGSQLSGGVDSSLVTAFAAECLPKGGLETISIIFGNRLFSEKIFIDQVVRKFNLKSHQYTLDSEVFQDLLWEAVWHFEQPLNHPNTIGIKLLSREAKKHVTVLLSGEGADEALGGYDRFMPDRTSFTSISTLRNAYKNASKLLQFLRIWKSEENRYILQTAFGNIAGAYMLYPLFSVEQAIQSRRQIWNMVQDNFPGDKRKYELLTYLPDLLMRQDKMSMAHSIENRVPFLDNEVLDASFCISDDQIIRKRNGKWECKYILKEICSEIFDESFAYRNKMGFSIPLRQFFTSKLFLQRWYDEISPSIQQRGIFNYKPINDWMIKTNTMSSEQLDAVWLMLGFEIWASQYLD